MSSQARRVLAGDGRFDQLRPDPPNEADTGWALMRVLDVLPLPEGCFRLRLPCGHSVWSIEAGEYAICGLCVRYRHLRKRDRTPPPKKVASGS